VPVILITGYPDDPRLARAQKLGIRRMFVKGDFQLGELLVAINSLAINAGETVSPSLSRPSP